MSRRRERVGIGSSNRPQARRINEENEAVKKPRRRTLPSSGSLREEDPDALPKGFLGRPFYEKVYDPTVDDRSPSREARHRLYSQFAPFIVDPEEAVFQQLQQKIYLNRKDFREAFRLLDKNHDGYISRADFKDGLQQLQLKLNDRELDRLIDRYSEGKDYIKFDDFVKRSKPARYSYGLRNKQPHVESLLPLEGRPSSEGRKEERRAEQEKNSLLRQLRERIAARRRDVAKVFLMMHPDSHGCITKESFKDGLDRLNCGFSAPEAARLADALDDDHDGFISFAEFAQNLRGPESLSPTDFYQYKRPPSASVSALPFVPALKTTSHVCNLIFDKPLEPRVGIPPPTPPKGPVSAWSEVEKSDDAAIRAVQDKLYRKYERINDAFRSLDHDHNGVITPSELSRGLQQMNMPFSHAQMDRIAGMVDANNDGKITFSEFCSVLKIPTESGRYDPYHIAPSPGPPRSQTPGPRAGHELPMSASLHQDGGAGARDERARQLHRTAASAVELSRVKAEEDADRPSSRAAQLHVDAAGAVEAEAASRPKTGGQQDEGAQGARSRPAEEKGQGRRGHEERTVRRYYDDEEKAHRREDARRLSLARQKQRYLEAINADSNPPPIPAMC